LNKGDANLIFRNCQVAHYIVMYSITRRFALLHIASVGDILCLVKTRTTQRGFIYGQVGGRVAAARRRKGWSQTDLAKRARLTRGSVANIELGRQRAPLETVWRIGEALGIEPRMLLPSMSDFSAKIEVRETPHLPPQVEGYIARLGDAETKVKALIRDARAELEENTVREKVSADEKKAKPD